MAYEHKEGRGTMFIPDSRTSDHSPNWKGKFKLNGQIFEISAWEEKTQQDKPKLSLSVQLPRQQSDTPQRRVDIDSHNVAKGNGYVPQMHTSNERLDDSDLPF